LSEEKIEELKKRVEALEAELANVKARCILREEEAEETVEAESTAGEGETSESYTE